MAARRLWLQGRPRERLALSDCGFLCMCVPCMCVLVRVLPCGLISLRSTLRLLAYVVYRQPRTSWLWGGGTDARAKGQACWTCTYCTLSMCDEPNVDDEPNDDVAVVASGDRRAVVSVRLMGAAL